MGVSGFDEPELGEVVVTYAGTVTVLLTLRFGTLGENLLVKGERRTQYPHLYI